MSDSRAYEYVCDSGTAKRVSRALSRFPRIVAFVALGLATLGAVLAFLGGSWSSVVVPLVLGLLLLWQSGPRRFRSVAPGRRFIARFGHSEVEFKTERATVRVPYSSFAGLKIRGGVTMYKVRDSRQWCGVPMEIFPPAEVEFVRGTAGI